MGATMKKKKEAGTLKEEVVNGLHFYFNIKY